MSDLLLPELDAESSEPSDLIVHLKTETGSLYELNLSAKTWRRLQRTERSGALRAEGGRIWLIGPVRKGMSLSLAYVPFDGDVARLLVTSPVVWISTGLFGRRQSARETPDGCAEP